jgi:hypothetical protein
MLRWRERVRLEEQAASELRRVRVDALMRFVNAVAAHSTAKSMVLGMKAHYATRPPTELSEAQRVREYQRLDEATTGLMMTMASDARLLPREARHALDPGGGDLHRRLLAAETQQDLLSTATAIAKILDDYLPELPTVSRRS